ncbi:MAG: hypothetical protein ACYSUF_05460 [Planctomycetota bacterium]
MAVVVSEETGAIALVEQGIIQKNVSREQFREELLTRLEGPPAGPIGFPLAAPPRGADDEDAEADQGTAAVQAPGERSAAMAKEA